MDLNYVSVLEAQIEQLQEKMARLEIQNEELMESRAGRRYEITFQSMGKEISIRDYNFNFSYSLKEKKIKLKEFIIDFFNKRPSKLPIIDEIYIVCKKQYIIETYYMWSMTLVLNDCRKWRYESVKIHGEEKIGNSSLVNWLNENIDIIEKWRNV
jgi:hypothetical protein